MSKQAKINSCKYLGHDVNFSHSWWCNKQFTEPNETHKNCDCSNCPDFGSIEYEFETTSNISENNDIPNWYKDKYGEHPIEDYMVTGKFKYQNKENEDERRI